MTSLLMILALLAATDLAPVTKAVQSAATWEDHGKIIEENSAPTRVLPLIRAYQQVSAERPEEPLVTLNHLHAARVYIPSSSLQLLVGPVPPMTKPSMSSESAVMIAMRGVSQKKEMLFARYMLSVHQREPDLPDPEMRFLQYTTSKDSKGNVTKGPNGKPLRIPVHEVVSDKPALNRRLRISQELQRVAPDSPEALFAKAALLEKDDRKGYALLKRAYETGASRDLWRFDCLGSMALRARRLEDPKLIAEVTALLDKAKRDRPNALLMRISYVEPTLAGTWPPKSG